MPGASSEGASARWYSSMGGVGSLSKDGKKAIAKNPSLTFNFVWAATWKTSNVFQVRNSASDSAENI